MSNRLYRSIIIVFPNYSIIIGSGSLYSSGRAVQPSYQPYRTGMRTDSQGVGRYAIANEALLKNCDKYKSLRPHHCPEVVRLFVAIFGALEQEF